jgi:cytochrome c5
VPTQAPPATETASPAQSATATTAIDAAQLLDTRCSACHSANVPKSQRMTREQWDRTVSLMISRGAQLSDVEKGVLVDYLAKTYGP